MRVPFLDLAALHAEVRDQLDKAWHETIERNGFVGGEALDRFEQDFAGFCGAAHAVGVANGTDALELVLAGLGIGPGDEVIVPANTFIATAEAVVRVGATPVFVDVDRATALLTPEHVSAALTPRTAAVMAVHLYGQLVDMPALLAVCDPAGVAVIEDAAQAHGATLNGRRAGSFGVAAGFSFYPGKNLGALGDGGAVTTDDAALAERIRSMTNHGRAATSRYHHDLVGRNSRLDGLQAAALSIKLAEIDRWNSQRRELADRYRAGLPAAFRPMTQANGLGVHHLMVVESDMAREVVGAHLDAHEIGWGVHYPVPCHRQPAYASHGPDSLPVSEALAERIISLPMYPQLGAHRVERVCDVLDGLSEA